MEIVSEDDVEETELQREETHFRRKQLGAPAGGERIGCSRYELPPGGKSWPYHYHAGNEEAIYVLAGEGKLRLDGDTHEVRAGDYVALPADDSGAHRVINDSGEPLAYLAMSTMDEPDVTVYPDSEKLGVFVGGAPGEHSDRSLQGYYRIDDDVGYWDDG